MKDYVDIAIRYARSLKDKNIAMKDSCRRFIRDLECQKQWVLNVQDANKACKFIESHIHYKGPLASKNKLVSLEPWQIFYFVNVLGWRNSETNDPRFREVILRAGRKNGLSMMAHLLGLASLEFKLVKEVVLPNCSGMHFKYQQDSFKLLQKKSGYVKTNKLLSANDNEPLCLPLNLIDETQDPISMFRFDCFNAAFYSYEITSIYTNFKERFYTDLLAKQKLPDEVFVCVFENDGHDDLSNPETYIKSNPNVGVSLNMAYLIHVHSHYRRIRPLAKHFGINPLLNMNFEG